jgi:hypothetical protein
MMSRSSALASIIADAAKGIGQVIGTIPADIPAPE